MNMKELLYKCTLNVLVTSCTSGPPYTWRIVGYFWPGTKLCGLNTIANNTSPELIWCVTKVGLWRTLLISEFEMKQLLKNKNI